MARAVLDAVPQRRLVFELKAVIDRAMHSDGIHFELLVGRLSNLLLENPHSALGAHVKHNLGCARRRWVRQLSTTLPRSEVTDLMWQLGCDSIGVAIPKEDQV